MVKQRRETQTYEQDAHTHDNIFLGFEAPTQTLYHTAAWARKQSSL